MTAIPCQTCGSLTSNANRICDKHRPSGGPDSDAVQAAETLKALLGGGPGDSNLDDKLDALMGGGADADPQAAAKAAAGAKVIRKFLPLMIAVDVLIFAVIIYWFFIRH
jgi:hypothetical protein